VAKVFCGATQKLSARDFQLRADRIDAVGCQCALSLVVALDIWNVRKVIDKFVVERIDKGFIFIFIDEHLSSRHRTFCLVRGEADGDVVVGVEGAKNIAHLDEKGEQLRIFGIKYQDGLVAKLFKQAKTSWSLPPVMQPHPLLGRLNNVHLKITHDGIA